MTITSPGLSCSVVVLVALMIMGVALDLAAPPAPALPAAAQLGDHADRGGYSWAAWAEAASH